MNLETESPCRKMNGKNCSFDFKIFVIEQINNGQISLNFAAKKYNVNQEKNLKKILMRVGQKKTNKNIMDTKTTLK